MNPKSKQFRPDKIYKALVVILLGGLILPPLSRSFWEFANQKISYVAALDGKTGNLLWSVFPDKIKIISLTAHSGKIVIAGRDENTSWERQKYTTYHLLNLKSESGKQNWHFKQKMTGTNAHDMTLFSPEMSKEKLLVAFRSEDSNMETQIIALGMNDGQMQWKINRPWGGDIFQTGMTIWENQSAVLRISSTDVLLQKYDAETGKKAWEISVEKIPKWAKFPLQLGMFYRLRSTDRQILLLNQKTNSLYVFDWENGKLKSKYSNFYSLSSQILFLNDLAVYHITGQALQSSNLTTGKQLWKVDLEQEKCGLPLNAAILTQGLLITCIHFLSEEERKKTGGSFLGELVFFDHKTGQQKWSQKFPERRVYPLSSVNSDHVFISRDDRLGDPRELIALDQTDGHVVWQKPTILHPYISPVVDANRIVVVGQKPRWQTWFSFIPFK
jgi:outer membrane protein assembly factor BamB